MRQLLSSEIVEGREERYQFTWPDKRKAILAANAPVNATLRPCREESVDFDTTQNLYIEGDNLDVLKCLKETYLHKVKMIYIDPPYNTGNDFVYEDDFAESTAEYLANSGQFDEQGNRMVTNTESNGRFHTDWLNMIYPRLKVARDLLTKDGVIFISIGEEEVENLKKVCKEIFGEDSFRNAIISRRYDKNLNRQFMESGLKTFNIGFEYILCFAKKDFLFAPVFKKTSDERSTKGYWKGFWNDADRPTMRYDILGFTPSTGQWKWSKQMADEAVKNYIEYIENFSEQMSIEDYWIKTGKSKKFIRRSPNGKGKNAGVENWIAPSDGILRNTNWLDFLASKNDNTTQGLFDFPKNVDLIKEILSSTGRQDSLILDFFSGSATTAHAVMQLNAEDGGNRKFIMVQLPELTDEKSEAYKAGYKTICEIGKERIRRAGAKINEELGMRKLKNEELGMRNEELGLFAAGNSSLQIPNSGIPNNSSSLTPNSGIPDNSSFLTPNSKIDVGFRVLKLDSTNMEDIYYSPEETKQRNLFNMVDNVKPDRTGEDLLFQVMLELGAELNSSIRKEELGIKGNEELGMRNEELGEKTYTIYDVANGYIVACFDQEVTDEVVTAIAKMKPQYAVLRDTSMKNDSTATNFEQIFKRYSPNTVTKIL